MGLLHVRVDDRLIHGQIISAWAKSLNIQSIIAIDNEMAENEMIAEILIMGVPKEYNPKIVTQKEAIDLVEKGLPTRNIMLITRFPKNLRSIMKDLEVASEINLGNLSKQADSIYISKKIGVGQLLCFSEEDIETLDELENTGIKVITRQMPKDKEVPWSTIRTNLKKIE